MTMNGELALEEAMEDSYERFGDERTSRKGQQNYDVSLFFKQVSDLTTLPFNWQLGPFPQGKAAGV
jgi:hypothetical protein